MCVYVYIGKEIDFIVCVCIDTYRYRFGSIYVCARIDVYFKVNNDCYYIALMFSSKIIVWTAFNSS